MEAIFSNMKALYDARRLSGINAFMEKWIAPDCVVMGTSLGELMLTGEDVRGIFDSDLRYWHDLSIDAESAVRSTVGDTAYVTCPAEISYTILENEKRYESYADWCAGIAEDSALPPRVRGAQIAFILDTLLSSRKNKRRKNRLPLTVRVLLRHEKAVFISFAFDKTPDTADYFMGDSADTQKSYSDERALLGGGGQDYIAKSLQNSGFTDAAFDCRGSIFFGSALKQRTETLDEAMSAVLADYKQDDPYRTLYDLRLRIAFLQKIYAIEEHPRAVVRFFGLAEDGEVKLFVPTYPLGSYMEWK